MRSETEPEGVLHVASEQVEVDPEVVSQELRELGWQLDQDRAPEEIERVSESGLDTDTAAGITSLGPAATSAPTCSGLSFIFGEGLYDHLQAWPITFPPALMYKQGQTAERLRKPNPSTSLPSPFIRSHSPSQHVST